MKQALFFAASFFLGVLNISAQSNPVALPRPEQLRFTENKGQWHQKISFRADIPNGKLLLEKNAFYFFLQSADDLLKIQHPGNKEEVLIHGHAFKEEFVGANPNPVLQGQNSFSDYANYYLGNDSHHWASNAKIFSQVNYAEVYTGIDLRVYTKQSRQLKYDWVVKPNADVSKIKIRYTGVDKLQIANYELRITTSVGDLVEEKPFAYQEINGFKKEVKCNFILNSNELSFDFVLSYL